MRPSLRFLGLAVVGWAGVRAATLGILPGAELLKVTASEAKGPPAVAATQFPPIAPAQPMQAMQGVQPGAGYYGPPPAGYYGQPPAGYYPPMPAGYYQPQPVPIAVRPIAVPVYYASLPVQSSRRFTPIIPAPPPQFYAPIPALDEWPLSRIASAGVAARRSTVVAPMQSLPTAELARNGIDRLQLSAWALLRGSQGLALGPPSLAAGGTLGGSQAGTRLMYNFTRQIAATLRSSTDVGRRGGEVAAGMRIQPVGGLPLWFTAERRQRIGAAGGSRNAFALFGEAGVWQRTLPWHFALDGYLQGGVVGLRNREAFVDGGLTVTRPVYKQFSAGLGVWGGAQPGVYRVDAGPRITMKVRNNMRIHFDYRQRLAGNALPGSGPAVTLAGDF